MNMYVLAIYKWIHHLAQCDFLVFEIEIFDLSDDERIRDRKFTLN
jgi:hypothetical protein